MTTATKKSVPCKSCGAPILWAVGPDGKKWMPVDAQEVPNGNLRLYLDVPTRRLRWAHEIPSADRVAYRAHWRTCPNAASHRTKKAATEAPPERPSREQLDMFGGGGQRPRPLHADDGGKS